MDISHFEISINGTPMSNETNITKSFTMRAYPVCSCGTHYISIVAVNRCGRVGQNVTEVVNYPEPDVMCDSNVNSVDPRPNIGNETESSMIM